MVVVRGAGGGWEAHEVDAVSSTAMRVRWRVTGVCDVGNRVRSGGGFFGEVWRSPLTPRRCLDREDELRRRKRPSVSWREPKPSLALPPTLFVVASPFVRFNASSNPSFTRAFHSSSLWERDLP